MGFDVYPQVVECIYSHVKTAHFIPCIDICNWVVEVWHGAISLLRLLVMSNTEIGLFLNQDTIWLGQLCRFNLLNAEGMSGRTMLWCARWGRLKAKT